MKGPSRRGHAPAPALADLLGHASSAARVVGQLDDRDDRAALEQLSDHVDAIVHGLSELVGEHRLATVDDEAAVVDELRHFMARADALASATNELFSRSACRGWRRSSRLHASGSPRRDDGAFGVGCV